MEHLAADGVHLGVELHVQDAVAQVLDGGACVFPNHGRIGHVGQHNAAFLSGNDFVVFLGGIVEVAQSVTQLVKASVAGVYHVLDPGSRGFSSFFHVGQRFLHAHRIPGFERANLPAKTGFECVVHFVELVADLRHAVAYVLEQRLHHFAVELTGLVLALV